MNISRSYLSTREEPDGRLRLVLHIGNGFFKIIML
jgi:hypothetical protein